MKLVFIKKPGGSSGLGSGFIAVVVAIGVMTAAGCSSQNNASAPTAATAPAVAPAVDSPGTSNAAPESMSQMLNDPRIPADVKATIKQKMSQ